MWSYQNLKTGDALEQEQASALYDVLIIIPLFNRDQQVTMKDSLKI